MISEFHITFDVNWTMMNIKQYLHYACKSTKCVPNGYCPACLFINRICLKIFFADKNICEPRLYYTVEAFKIVSDKPLPILFCNKEGKSHKKVVGDFYILYCNIPT